MKPARYLLAAFCFSALQSVSLGVTGDQNDDVTTVPMTSDMEDAVADALHGYLPKGELVSGVNKNKVYVLSGKLFGDGNIYALVDHDPMLVAKWDGKKWKLNLALSLTPTWNHPGWENETPGRGPEADKPFWTIQLQGRSLLIVPSYVEKEGQHYYSILLNGDVSSVLESDDSIPEVPKVQEGYLVSTDCSRVKAEETDTYFSRIEHDKFVVHGEWDDCVPWFAETDSQNLEFMIATAGKQSYLIEDEEAQPLKKPFWGYVVFKGSFRPESWAEIDAEKANRPYATVLFQMRKKHSHNDPDRAGGDIEYIFERLLNLPRSLFPADDPNAPPVHQAKIESVANIKVTGDPGLVRLLLPSTAH